MGNERAVSGFDQALFDDLLRQVDEFLVDANQPAAARRAQAALVLANASRRVAGVMASAVAVGTPLAVAIHQGRHGRCVRCVHYRDLPHPLTLLILAASQFEAGDTIAVVIQRAGLPDLRRKAVWPFDLTTAEWLTRPSDNETPS